MYIYMYKQASICKRETLEYSCVEKYTAIFFKSHLLSHIDEHLNALKMTFINYKTLC